MENSSFSNSKELKNLTFTSISHISDRGARNSKRQTSDFHLTHSRSLTDRETYQTELQSDCLEDFDVHTIIEKYRNQPELLELILSCKVHEDKRKTEEARLKQRELDYLISNEEEISKSIDHVHINQDDRYTDSNLLNGRALSSPSSQHLDYENNRQTVFGKGKGKERQDKNFKRFLFNEKGYPTTITNDYSSYVNKQLPSLHHQISSPSILIDYEKSANQQSSSLPSLKLPLYKSNSMRNFQNIHENETTYQRHRRTSETCLDYRSMNENTLLPPIQFSKNMSVHLSDAGKPSTSQCSNLTAQLKNQEKSIVDGQYNVDGSLLSEPRPEFSMNKRRKSEQHALPIQSEINQDQSSSRNSDSHNASSLMNQDISPKKLLLPIHSSPRNMASDNDKARRRRKEMQPISLVVETKEFPYNDGYVWKNNGNTTHKSSGQKSIYYKCSSSNKGCTVNKTVTFKENGEYLIKYRGQHLEDCDKIKKIVNNVNG